MGTRTYGQYCGLARAFELVGERWAMLVVRDLLLGPKRFTDLQRGLPRIPSNVLSSRLKELEEAGIVRRRVLPRPSSAVVYELTDYGRELEGPLLELMRWGAKSLGEPTDDDGFSPNSFLLGMRSMFQPDAARGVHVTYEVRIEDSVFHLRVGDGALELGDGPAPDADATLETDLAALQALMRGTLEEGSSGLRFTGNRRLLARFGKIFSLPSPLG